jgi:hypothetical protein
MKHTLTFLLFVLCCNTLYAQYMEIAPVLPTYPIVSQPGATLGQVVNMMYANANTADTGEGGEMDQINQFNLTWQTRVTANDSSGVNMFQQYYRALGGAISARVGATCPGGGFSGAWSQTDTGSLPVQASGYTWCVWAGAGADSNMLLAGTGGYGGGLFESMDGGGHWANITDNAPVGGMIGVMNIAVDPANVNNIYLGTNGAGIVASADGGTTWGQEFIMLGASPAPGDTTESPLVYITPDGSRLYATCGNELFTRLAAGAGSWANITPPTPADSIIDFTNVAFVPGRPQHFFVSGQYWNMYRGVGDTAVHPVHTRTGFVWESKVAQPAGADWTNDGPLLADTLTGFSISLGGGTYTTTYDTVIFHATDFSWFCISVPDTNTLYTVGIPLFPASTSPISYAGGGLYKYHFNSSSPSWHGVSHNVSPYPSVENLNFAVSPADSTVMYYTDYPAANLAATLRLPYVSEDGGQTFNPIGAYGGEPTHGDVRGMYVQKAAADGE